MFSETNKTKPRSELTKARLPGDVFTNDQSWQTSSTKHVYQVTYPQTDRTKRRTDRSTSPGWFIFGLKPKRLLFVCCKQRTSIQSCVGISPPPSFVLTSPQCSSRGGPVRLTRHENSVTNLLTNAAVYQEDRRLALFALLSLLLCWLLTTCGIVVVMTLTRPRATPNNRFDHHGRYVPPALLKAGGSGHRRHFPEIPKPSRTTLHCPLYPSRPAVLWSFLSSHCCVVAAIFGTKTGRLSTAFRLWYLVETSLNYWNWREKVSRRLNNIEPAMLSQFRCMKLNVDYRCGQVTLLCQITYSWKWMKMSLKRPLWQIYVMDRSVRNKRQPFDGAVTQYAYPLGH